MARRTDVNALAAAGDIEALRQLADKGDVSAVWPLRVIGVAALPALLALLESPSETIREITAEELQELPDARSFEPLRRVVMNTDESPYVRKEACIALAAIGDERALRPILDLIDEFVAEDDSTDGVIAYAAIALGELRHPAGVPHLRGLITHPDVGVQLSAGRALIEIGTAAALESARALLKDPSLRLKISDALESKGVLSSADELLVADDRARRDELSARERQLFETFGFIEESEG